MLPNDVVEYEEDVAVSRVFVGERAVVGGDVDHLYKEWIDKELDHLVKLSGIDWSKQPNPLARLFRNFYSVVPKLTQSNLKKFLSTERDRGADFDKVDLKAFVKEISELQCFVSKSAIIVLVPRHIEASLVDMLRLLETPDVIVFSLWLYEISGSTDESVIKE